jgi:hypothetical protein
VTAKKKNTNGSDERKDREREDLRRELEALYAANLPSKDDDRVIAIAIAKELDAEISHCVHALRANDGAEKAAEKLRRMRRALHQVTMEEDLAPAQIVPVLKAVREMMKLRPETYKHPLTIEVLREGLTEPLADWSDRQIMAVLTSHNFNVSMSHALDEHGYKMGPSNIDRILKGRKKARSR